MKRESVLFYFQKAAHLLPLFLFGLALFIVHNELKTHHIDHIFQSVKAVPLRILAMAVALTVFNYIVLAG